VPVRVATIFWYTRTMDSAIVITLIVFLILQVGTLWFFMRNQKKTESSDGMSLMLQQINEHFRTLDQKVGETSKVVHESLQIQFGESQKLIRDVTKELTEVKETGKQVFSVTESLKTLEKVLTNQKQRGTLGEAGLELILSNILPPGAYELQYGFANGDKVDAAIKTKDGLIPVDAKFSLDNYKRVIEALDLEQKEKNEEEFRKDLKKRIDETSKYIRPEEGTLPFALMYIPAEGIYYDLLVNQVGAVKVNTQNLIDYAYNEKKVVIVSPTTFAAYLQTILQGFRAFQIEKKAVEIEKNVQELTRHLKAYEDFYKKLGGNLSTVVNQYNLGYKEYKKIDKDVLKITGEAIGIEALVVDKPTDSD